MPEGDTLHGIADRARRCLEGQVLTRALSPRVPLARWEGQTLVSASAHGKHLLLTCATGQVLHTHLGMNGSVRFRSETYTGTLTNPHVRWLLSCPTATVVCLDAPTVELLSRESLREHPVLRSLGPDLVRPGLTAEELPGAILARLRSAPDQDLGVALMDQRLFAGIGNVYKSEVLFLCSLSPFERTHSLEAATLTRLIETAHDLLRRNVGSVRRTTPRGRIGTRHWVYERGSEPCHRCGTPIAMVRQGPLARSTYYCPSCQRQAALAHGRNPD